jgi:hypothetical protein
MLSFAIDSVIEPKTVSAAGQDDYIMKVITFLTVSDGRPVSTFIDARNISRMTRGRGKTRERFLQIIVPGAAVYLGSLSYN